MKPKKIPEIVNLVDLTEEGLPKVRSDRPLTLNKSELRERYNRRPGEIKFYRGEQRPEYEEKVKRKRACPICAYSNGRLMAVCLKCKNCMACGSYTDDSTNEVCPTCGNYNSTPPPEPVTINFGI